MHIHICVYIYIYIYILSMRPPGGGLDVGAHDVVLQTITMIIISIYIYT